MRDTYFGWNHLAPHKCSKPKLDVTYKIESPEYAKVDRLAVRIVCLNCGLAVVLGATTPRDRDDETHVIVERRTSATMLGYGLPGFQVAKLYAWPDAPLRTFGAMDMTPYGYLVTTTPDRPREPSDCVAAISQRLTARGAVRWTASIGTPYAMTDDAPTRDDFKTPTAAIRWVSATLPDVAAPFEGITT